MAKDTKFNLTIKINGKEVQNTLSGVGKEIGKLKRELKNLNESDPKFNEKTKELQKARERYAQIKNEIDGTNVSLQEARGHWNNLFTGLITGDIDNISAGLKGLSSNIKGVTKSAWAFIATPIGAAIAVLSGVALATKEWINYNEEVKKANITTSEITNLVGEELDQARIRAQALADVFEKITFEENLETAKALVKAYGISYKDAFDLIEDSYVRGASVNKDFTDSVIEFSPIMAKAGFTAKENIDLINKAYENGLYKDKFIDSIHEVDTALTEQTNSTKEALENAFGEKFTKKLFKNISDGSITTKDAIKLIAKESQTAQLNVQQYGQLTADVFKSAGEDIAGSKKVLEVYNQALNQQQEALTPVQAEMKRLSDAHLELKQAQDDALKSDSYAKFSNDVSIVWTKTKTFFYNSVGAIVHYFQQWFLGVKIGFSDLKIAFKSLPMRFSETKNILVKTALEIVGAFKYLGDAWSNLKDFDFKGVGKSFTQFGASIKNSASNAIDEYGKIGDKIDEVQKKARQSIIKEYFDSQTGAGELQEKETQEPTKTVNTNTNSDKLKKELAKKKDLIQKSEEELDALIKKIQEQRELQQKQGVERELATIDNKYAKLKEKFTLSKEQESLLSEEELTKHHTKMKDLEAAHDLERKELKLQRDAEFKERVKTIEEENRIEEEAQKFERDAAAAATEEERVLILLDKAKWIATEELKIEEQKELAKVEAVEGAEKLKEAIRKKYSLKQAKVDATFEQGKKKVKKEEVKFSELTEQQKVSNVKQGLGQAAEAFNKGSAGWKAMKISEAVMSTYEGAQNAFTSLSKIPFIGPALGITAAAAAIKAGLNRVMQIKNTPKAKVETGYFQGGYTGDKPIRYDYQDGVAMDTPNGPYHINEWVAPKWMNESPRYAPTIQYLERERLKGPGFFDGGFNRSSSTPTPTFEEENSNETSVINERDEIMMSLLFQLKEQLDRGIKAYNVKDYEDFLRQKEIDQEHEEIYQKTRS